MKGCINVSYLDQLYFTVLCVIFLLANFGDAIEFSNPENPPLVQISCIYCNNAVMVREVVMQIFTSLSENRDPKRHSLR